MIQFFIIRSHLGGHSNSLSLDCISINLSSVSSDIMIVIGWPKLNNRKYAVTFYRDSRQPHDRLTDAGKLGREVR